MKRTAIAASLVPVLAAACTTVPLTDESLVQAREAYAIARDDPHVARFAAGELAEAGQALTYTEQLAARNASPAEVAHQAYLAEQRAYIARYVAMARAAEAELARADSERERVILQARAREAEVARERAEAQLREAQQAEGAQKEALREELARMESQIADLKTRETDRGLVLTFGTEVLFDTGEATLKPGSRRTLENVARFVAKQPRSEVVIEGFTDSVGPDEFNQRLSERRAEAVKRALEDQGVPGKAITARGLGEAYPVASNATPAGRQLNRRVEIVLPREPSGAASVGR